MVWSIVVAVSPPLKFWITPCETSTTANTAHIGRRMRVIVRVRSTQKFPIVRAPVRAMPRMIATTTAIPTAADTKFCTVRPSICVRWLTVSSGEYHCQLVLVTKLTAMLKAPNGATAPWFVGLNGRPPCRRSIRYRPSTDSRLNANIDRA